MDILAELGRRRLLVATVTVAAAGATAAFSFTAADRYRATAVLVVQPVPPGAPAFLGLDVLHDTARRPAAATAARLVLAPEVAEAVRVRLGLHGSAQQLLGKVSSHVADGSDAVEVTATDTSPARAAQIANGFVDAFVTQRSAGFQSELQSSIRRLRLRLAGLVPAARGGPQGAELTSTLASLRRWVGFADPTVKHGSEAAQPRSAVWPHPYLWTLYGGLGGLAAGCLAALALGLAATVRRREAVGAADYDPRMPDRAIERVVERLERRLAERTDALAAEQARLAAREAELAAREQQAAAAAEPPATVDVDAEAERRLAAGRAELDERAKALERRERALAARTEELRTIEARVDEQRGELGRRERELAAQAEELRTRPPAAAPAAPAAPLPAETPAPASAPAPQPPAAAAPAPAVEPVPVRVEEPAPRPAAASPNGWQLDELEQLVDLYADEYPEHAEEWRSYLFYLRDYADASGRVPSHFDWLVEDTFGRLLVRR